MVSRNASAYERELRYLLEGDGGSVRGYARALPPPDRPEFEHLTEAPFLVIRGAGSLGFDLVALRRDYAFPLEVKASAEPVIRFTAASGRAEAQLAAHRSAVQRVGLTVLYAYRRIGRQKEEPWRIFLGSSVPQRGVLKGVCSHLPHVSATAQGHGVLRWEEGMPLSKFLHYAYYFEAPPAPPPP